MLGKVTRYIGYPAQLSKVKFLEFLPEQILRYKYVEIFSYVYNLLCFDINLDKFYFFYLYDNINIIIYNIIL